MSSDSHIVAVSVGRPRLVVHQGQSYTTAINKSAVDGPVELTDTGFVGDKQANTQNHGGPDKAVCCYPHEHYGYFAVKLGCELPAPSFGENLTTRGLIETEVAIGDTYRIGAATLQVTQPREPCVKLARLHDEPQLGNWIHDTGYTGFYLRVLDAAPIAAGDPVELLDRPHPEHTIAHAMQTQFGEYNADALRSFLDNPALSDAWRTRMIKRLDGASQ